jgi:WD40 repeat protein
MLVMKHKKIEMFQETGHLQNHPLISVSFNRDNEFLASASQDGIICVRSVLKDKKDVMQFQETQRITMIRFSHVKPYILASAHENGKISIWDI